MKADLFPRILALSILMLCGMAAHAQSDACDMSQLNLTAQQNEQMRHIREQFRQMRSRGFDSDDSNQRYRNYLLTLSNQASFNEAEARQYLKQINMDRSERQLQIMRIQFQVAKILNPHQRELWLRNCARP